MSILAESKPKPKSKKSKSRMLLKQQIVNIFRVEAHNMRHYRLACSLIPGKSMRDMEPDDAAAGGHFFVVEAMQKHGRCYTRHGVNRACEIFNLELFHYLRATGIHCPPNGTTASS